ncbi:MAG: hypothetical protein JJE29_04695 [Peptostreptococcaceae bacterium]|nr:hypothetical protein [Peptostreptococcaceae bacterium]
MWPGIDGQEAEYYVDIQIEAKEYGNDAVVAAGSAEIICRNGFYSVLIE